MTRFSRRAALRAAGAFAAAWSLPGFGATPSTELRIAMSADVTSIDPHFLNVQPNNQVAFHLYDALTHVDARARLVPGLAESWRAVDPVTWEFRLRKGVRFHDGSAFTADDVVFSLERPPTLTKSPGPFTGFVRPIVAKEVVDPYTIRLKTATPYAMVPQDLHSVVIVSKRAATGAASEDFDTGKAAIGTGPFRFGAFRRGDRVELLRNDGYWGGRPAWEKVTLRLMPTDATRVASLLSGDVDVIEHIPTADLARLRADARLRLEQTTSWRTIFFHLDQGRDRAPFVTDRAGKPLERNPFRDVRVRRAVSLAINRAAIVERVMDGFALPAANVVAPPVFGHVAARKADPYQLDEAKRLLAEAGFPEGFGLTLHAPNNRYVNDEQIAQAVAQMLTRAGIATKVETMPVATYFTRARNLEFSVAMLGWGSFSGDLALRTLAATFDTQSGYGAWNWGRYGNPKVDALLKEGFATTDEGRREAIARDAAALALGEYALIPVHHQIASWAMKRAIRYAPRTDEYTFAHQFSPER